MNFSHIFGDELYDQTHNVTGRVVNDRFIELYREFNLSLQEQLEKTSLINNTMISEQHSYTMQDALNPNKFIYLYLDYPRIYQVIQAVRETFLEKYKIHFSSQLDQLMITQYNLNISARYLNISHEQYFSQKASPNKDYLHGVLQYYPDDQGEESLLSNNEYNNVFYRHLQNHTDVMEAIVQFDRGNQLLFNNHSMYSMAEDTLSLHLSLLDTPFFNNLIRQSQSQLSQ